MDIKQGIQAVVEGANLSQSDAADVMRQIMAGEATPAQFGAFVTALRMKGETPEEIAGMARSMREVSLHVETDLPVIDTCGTGGDNKGWFNISTAAAFVIAGAGVPVAKHGNRAMSGSSGSADALETLGVKIGLSPDSVKRCIEEVGIGFMFAQAFHPAMKFAGPLRPQIGIRTVFNLLGPLTNPAGAGAQVIGVYADDRVRLVADALNRLGVRRAFVVHGSDGLDEITTTGPTHIAEVRGGEVMEAEVAPGDFGVETAQAEDLAGGEADENALLLERILEGVHGPRRDVVVVNAAAALVAAGKADTFIEGAQKASESIDSGAAKAKLRTFIEFTNRFRAS